MKISPSEPKTELDCVFRADVTGTGNRQTAQCLLLAQLLSVAPSQCTVTRPMCLACQKQLGDRAFSSHPVFPSVTYQLALEHQETASSEDERQRWITLSTRAEQALLKQLQTPVSQTGIPSCDVILPIHHHAPRIGEVIDSVLQQVGAAPILHLVGSVESPAIEKYAGRWNVQIHRFDRQLLWPQTIATLSPHLRTGFIALQDPLRSNSTGHLAQALQELRDRGAELFVYQTDPVTPKVITIDANSLVIRRATLIDMEELPVTATAANIVELAIRQGRVVAWGQDLSAEEPTQIETVVRGQPAWTLPRAATVRRKVRCDVVLPFHGQLGYVEEALQSLLHLHIGDAPTARNIPDHHTSVLSPNGNVFIREELRTAQLRADFQRRRQWNPITKDPPSGHPAPEGDQGKFWVPMNSKGYRVYWDGSGWGIEK